MFEGSRDAHRRASVARMPTSASLRSRRQLASLASWRQLRQKATLLSPQVQVSTMPREWGCPQNPILRNHCLPNQRRFHASVQPTGYSFEGDT